MSGYAMVAFATLLGCLAGAAIWTYWLRRDRLAPLDFATIARHLILIGLLVRLCIAIANPAYNSPDERPHFKYVQYLWEERSFPVQRSLTDSDTYDWEYYQPPLYYLSLVPLYALGNSFTDDTQTLYTLVRLGSILWWLLFAWCAMRLLLRFEIPGPFVSTFVMVLVCLLPAYVFLSSSINNDILLITLGGVISLLLASESVKWRSALVGGLCLGAALLTKSSGLIYVALAAAILLLRARTGVRMEWRYLPHSIVVVAIGLLIWLPWAMRTQSLYGDPIGQGISDVPAVWETPLHALRDTYLYVRDSFWSAAGMYNKVRFLPTIGVHIGYLALAGWVWTLYKSPRECIQPYFSSKAWEFLIATLPVLILNLMLVAYFGYKSAHGHGRFLWPSLIPIAFFIAAGLSALKVNTVSRAHIHAAGFLVTYLLATVGFSLASFVQRGMQLFAPAVR